MIDLKIHQCNKSSIVPCLILTDLKKESLEKEYSLCFFGELIKLKFEFYGSKIEPVLDRLPTATILEQDFDKYVIEAEVYGKGIVMWLFSQSSSIKVLSPPSLVEENERRT